MEDIKLEAAVESLVKELRKTEEYRNYYSALNSIRDDSEAEAKINEIRELSIRVQNYSEEEMNRELENIERRVEEIGSDPKIEDFMLAEAEFSKLYQSIVERIIGSLDEELDEE